MARGLIENWKFPVAYYVVNKSVNADHIKNMIQCSLTALLRIGLDVKALVCDQGSTNRKAAGLLGVRKDSPYFTVEESKVFWIFDFPHILKCIRNNLMKLDKYGNFVGQIHTNKGTADWKYVNELYKLEQTSSTARATKLTKKHIEPNPFEKMSVKLAAQVMSHTTAAAMKTAIDCGQISREAEETASFLENMNHLFDSMNSRGQFDVNAYRCAVLNSTNDHLRKPIETIKNGLEWAKSWEVKGVTMAKEKRKRPPSFDGLELTLNSTLMLWEALKSEKVKYLLTGRLNQDPLENEFSVARQRHGYDRNPSATAFRLTMRHRIQSALLRPSSRANCEADDDEMLPIGIPKPVETSNSSAVEAQTADSDEQHFSCEDSDAESEVDDDDDVALDTAEVTNATLEGCAVRYFAGYAVRCCLAKFKCTTYLQDISKPAPSSSNEILPDESLVAHREYKDFGGALAYPSNDSVEATHIILTAFNKIFCSRLHCYGNKKKIAHKSQQIINTKLPTFLRFGDNCCVHRQFFVDKIIVAKIRRTVVDVSKHMRQPHCKSNKSVAKLYKLVNK